MSNIAASPPPEGTEFCLEYSCAGSVAWDLGCHGTPGLNSGMSLKDLPDMWNSVGVAPALAPEDEVVSLLDPVRDEPPLFSCGGEKGEEPCDPPPIIPTKSSLLEDPEII